MLLAACGQPAPPSASETLAAAKHAFQSLKSFHVSGTLSADSSSGIVQATVLSNGDAMGSLNISGETANFRVVSHTLYFDTLNSFVENTLDADTLALAQRLKVSHWWQTPGTHTVQVVMRFLDPQGFAVIFLSGRSHLNETVGKNRWTLQDSAGAAYLSASAPHEVLEVKSADNYLLNGATDIDFKFDKLNQAASVALPPSFLSTLPTSLPPFFVVNEVQVKGDCTASGCSVTAMVKPDAGNGGPATVNFTLEDKNHKPLGSCSVTVVLSSFNDVKPAGCHAGGAGWTRFFYGSGGTYYIHALASNPDYNP